MTIIQCKECWKEFEQRHYKQKLCHECLWPKCIICWKTINSIWHKTCWRECWIKYKSQKARELRLEKIWKRYCKICWKEIISTKLNIKTCWSKECIKEAKKIITKPVKWKDKKCKRCWKNFVSYNNCAYCYTCYNERICPICWNKIHWWRYETCWKKCAVILTQQLHWEEYKEYSKILHTKEVVAKASKTRKWKPQPWNRWPKYNRRWDNHPLWNWWSSKRWRRSIQYSPEYKSLIKSIYERDNYECQICWKRWWIMLNVHHIRTWDYYPELRMDPNNLVTLCEDCHKKVHRLWWWTHWATETFSILFKLEHEL